MQTSIGIKFAISKAKEGCKYLYNIDETGLCTIVEASAQDTSHLLLGQYSKAAGECVFFGDRVVLNEFTGHGQRNINMAAEAFASMDYIPIKWSSSLEGGLTTCPPIM